MLEYDFSDLDDVDDITELSQNWAPHKHLSWLAYCRDERLDPRVEEFDDDLLQKAIDDEVPLDELVGYLRQQAEREKAAQAEDLATTVAATQRQSERAKRRTQAKRLTKAKPTDVEAEMLATFRSWDAQQQNIFVARLQLEQDNTRAKENKAAVKDYGWIWKAVQDAALRCGNPGFPPIEVAAAQCEDFAARLDHLDWYIINGLPIGSSFPKEHILEIFEQCIASIIWYLGKKRGRSSVTITMVLEHIPQIEHIMNQNWAGLWEGRMLHWVAPQRIERDYPR